MYAYGSVKSMNYISCLRKLWFSIADSRRSKEGKVSLATEILVARLISKNS